MKKALPTMATLYPQSQSVSKPVSQSLEEVKNANGIAIKRVDFNTICVTVGDKWFHYSIGGYYHLPIAGGLYRWQEEAERLFAPIKPFITATAKPFASLGL